MSFISHHSELEMEDWMRWECQMNGGQEGVENIISPFFWGNSILVARGIMFIIPLNRSSRQSYSRPRPLPLITVYMCFPFRGV